MRHIMVGATAGVAIFAGIFIWKFLSKNILVLTLVLVAILSTNIIKILKENANGQTIFPLQVDLVLSKELRAVDYTYKKANGKNFSISTLTSPLFVNTLWSYLYNWYGKGKYGYLPFWRGRDQVGQLGNNLQIADPNIKEHFFIIEPTYGIPSIWVTYAKGDQDSISTLKDQKSFGELVVQERVMHFK